MPSPEWETDVADRAQVLDEARIVTGGAADLAGETTAINVGEAGSALMHRMNLNSAPAEKSQQHWDPA